MYFLFLVFNLIYITSVLLGKMLIQHSYNCCVFTLCMQENFVLLFVVCYIIGGTREGDRWSVPLLKNHKSIGFLCNTGSDP